jgi:hypothetical protein
MASLYDQFNLAFRHILWRTKTRDNIILVQIIAKNCAVGHRKRARLRAVCELRLQERQLDRRRPPAALW